MQRRCRCIPPQKSIRMEKAKAKRYWLTIRSQRRLTEPGISISGITSKFDEAAYATIFGCPPVCKILFLQSVHPAEDTRRSGKDFPRTIYSTANRFAVSKGYLFISIHQPYHPPNGMCRVLFFNIPIQSIIRSRFSFGIKKRATSTINPRYPKRGSSLIVIAGTLQSAVSATAVPSMETGNN